MTCRFDYRKFTWDCGGIHEVADAINLSESACYKRQNGSVEYRLSEVVYLCKTKNLKIQDYVKGV